MINRAKVSGTVIDRSEFHRQMLIETKTLTGNLHENLVTSQKFSTDEKIFVTVLDDRYDIPLVGERVEVNGLAKRINFCDSSLVEPGTVPIMEQSMSRIEVFAENIEPAGDVDINHVVLSGLAKSAYENVKGEFGTHGLIKVSLTSGMMFFLGDKLMKNAEDDFPFMKEAYHQYVENRKVITPIFGRRKKSPDQRHSDKDSFAGINTNKTGNVPILATCSIANLMKEDFDICDGIFQSRNGLLLET